MPMAYEYKEPPTYRIQTPLGSQAFIYQKEGKMIFLPFRAGQMHFKVNETQQMESKPPQRGQKTIGRAWRQFCLQHHVQNFAKFVQPQERAMLRAHSCENLLICIMNACFFAQRMHSHSHRKPPGLLRPPLSAAQILSQRDVSFGFCLSASPPTSSEQMPVGRSLRRKALTWHQGLQSLQLAGIFPPNPENIIFPADHLAQHQHDGYGRQPH